MARRRWPAATRWTGPRIRAGMTALLLLGTALPAEAIGTATMEEGFKRFTSAWRARSVKTIVDCIEPKGHLSLSLLRPRVSGRLNRDQAKLELTRYFRGVANPRLKDVTPKKSREKPVRYYDYTYRPVGGNEITTHLVVRLKQDRERRWLLASVREHTK